MNIEETKEAIKVMQAFVDGKTVQCRDREYDNGWQTTDGPLWSWGDFCYRIKPEPKEIWVNEYENGYNDFLYHDKETAESSATPYTIRKAVRYREIIE